MEKEKIKNEEIISELKLEIEDLKKQITYEDIARANGTIKTTDIKGKDYAEVNQRIKAFRMLHPNGTITTNIVSIENGTVVMKSTVMNEEGKILGTGLAYEKEGSTFINKTSYIENCETSAVGRALGMLGIGIETSVASKEEVENAIANQNEKQPTKKPTSAKNATVDYHKLLVAELNKRKINVPEFAQKNKLNAQTPQSVAKQLLEELTKGE